MDGEWVALNWRAFACLAGSDPEFIVGSLAPEVKVRLARQFGRSYRRLAR